MKAAVGRVFALIKRNVKEILRDPLSLAFMLAMPLGMELLFYFIFHGQSAQFEMKYLAPGIVAFAQAFLTLFSGLLISLDRSSAFLTRLYVSRAKSSEFIMGYAFSLFPIALAQSVIFFLVGGIIDPSIFSVTMIGAIFLSLIPAAFFIGTGILLGSLCNERSIGGVASIVIAGQSMLSCMWFPPESLGKGVLTVMRILPFKNAAELLQKGFLGYSDFFHEFWQPLLILLAYTVVIFALAIVVFGKKMQEK